MPYYPFKCEEHGEFIKLQSMKDYTGVFPCPECNKDSKRVFEGQAPLVRVGGNISGGRDVTYNFIKGQEENWIKDEVTNIKENVLNPEKIKSPYSHFSVSDPETAGFKKVDEKTARKRMESAKKFVKDTLNKKENQKKDK